MFRRRGTTTELHKAGMKNSGAAIMAGAATNTPFNGLPAWFFITRAIPVLRKRLDSDVLVLHSALRVMALQCERSVADHSPGTLLSAIPIRWLSPLHHFFPIQSDRDRRVPHDDVLRKPLVIFSDSLNVS